jgi:predicted amidohydrolase
MSIPARIAVVQAEVGADLATTLERTMALATEARDQGARLIVFPETWLPGYPIWVDCAPEAALWDHPGVRKVYRRMAEESIVVGDETTKTLAALAKSLRAAIVVGISERVESGPARDTLFNSALTFGPDGALLNHHRKLMPTHGERLVWGLGDAAGVRAVDTPIGRVGSLICWEHWMPLARQAMHESGEDIHVAMWPTAKETNHLACRNYAFEGRCFVIAAGALMRASVLPPELTVHPPVVSPDAYVLHGGSAIIGPDAQYIVPPLYDEQSILTAELDVRSRRELSMTLDVTGHYARPDCFTLERQSQRRAAVPELAIIPS